MQGCFCYEGSVLTKVRGVPTRELLKALNQRHHNAFFRRRHNSPSLLFCNPQAEDSITQSEWRFQPKYYCSKFTQLYGN